MVLSSGTFVFTGSVAGKDVSSARYSCGVCLQRLAVLVSGVMSGNRSSAVLLETGSAVVQKLKDFLQVAFWFSHGCVCLL